MATLLNLSFEFFPPKSEKGVATLRSTAAILSQYHPQYFSVTFGAGGSTKQGTIETVKDLQRTGIPIAPHISCVGATLADINQLLLTYQSLKIKRLVALRGDLPSGMVEGTDFRYANELIEFITKTTGDTFHIEVAAYPEIHPQAKCAQTDLFNLQRKFAAGAKSAITQYFYNPDAYFRFVDECHKIGISQPIIPGIMPITHYNNLARFSEICGAKIPRWICKKLESYGDDSEAIQQFGTEVVTHLCQQLISGGVQGLHFYTLNKANATVEILNNLGFCSNELIAKIS